MRISNPRNIGIVSTAVLAIVSVALLYINLPRLFEFTSQFAPGLMIKGPFLDEYVGESSTRKVLARLSTRVKYADGRVNIELIVRESCPGVDGVIGGVRDGVFKRYSKQDLFDTIHEICKPPLENQHSTDEGKPFGTWLTDPRNYILLELVDRDGFPVLTQRFKLGSPLQPNMITVSEVTAPNEKPFGVRFNTSLPGTANDYQRINATRFSFSVR